MTPPEHEQVHLWRIALDDQQHSLANLRAALSESESGRASRFHFAEHTRRYVASHGALRIILGDYVQLRPEEIEFCRTATGKPEIVAEQNPDGVFFNLTHSGELALVAVARRPLGVDVERIKARLELSALSARVLAEGELRRLTELPEDQRLRRFFRYWVHKEAYLKARGEGISGGLRRIEIQLAEAGRDAAIEDHRQPAGDSCWWISELEPGPGYAGAVVAEGRKLRLLEYLFGR